MAYELAGLIHDDRTILWPTPDEADELLNTNAFDAHAIEAALAMRVGDEIMVGEPVAAICCDWRTDEHDGAFVFRALEHAGDPIEQARLFLTGMSNDEDWAYDALGTPDA